MLRVGVLLFVCCCVLFPTTDAFWKAMAYKRLQPPGSLREAALMTSAGEDGGTSGHKKIESWAELPVVHYPSQQQSPYDRFNFAQASAVADSSQRR
ncbi:uncharacterized protein LOC142340176 isoform X2 [Convolutriloba macropyga]